MKNFEQGGEKFNRRSMMGVIGKSLAGLLVLGAQACAPRELNAYEVIISVIQSAVHYSPATIVVPPGATIVWQNRGIYPVSVTCDQSKAKGLVGATLMPKGAQPFDSGVLYPGQSWGYTFTQPGTYLYFSQFTPSPGLIGSVTVQ